VIAPCGVASSKKPSECGDDHMLVECDPAANCVGTVRGKVTAAPLEARSCTLLGGWSDSGGDFQTKYIVAMQESPDVIMAHAAVSRALSESGQPPRIR
jgi:hypothetical protein